MNRRFAALVLAAIVTAAATTVAVAAPATAGATTVLYLRGIGVPDSALWTSAPLALPLPNFDAWRDDAAGTTVERGTSGAAESDPDRYQAWWSGDQGWYLDGDAELTLYSAAKAFGPGNGSITAHLLDCGETCTQISEATVTLSRWQEGEDFAMRRFDFGQVTHTVEAGRRLGVKVTVSHLSSSAMWLAYATQEYPSALTIVTSASPATTTTTSTTTTTAAPTTTGPSPTMVTTTVTPTTDASGPPATAPTTTDATTTTLPPDDDSDQSALTPTTVAPPTTLVGGAPVTSVAPVASTVAPEESAAGEAPPPTVVQAPIRIGQPGASGVGANSEDRAVLPSYEDRLAAIPDFVVADDAAPQRRSSVQRVAAVFRSFVEDVDLNLLPAIILGILTTLLVLRGVDPDAKEYEGS